MLLLFINNSPKVRNKKVNALCCQAVSLFLILSGYTNFFNDFVKQNWPCHEKLGSHMYKNIVEFNMNNPQSWLSFMTPHLCIPSYLFLTHVTNVGENKNECTMHGAGSRLALSAYSLSPVVLNYSLWQEKQLAQPQCLLEICWPSLPKRNKKIVCLFYSFTNWLSCPELQHWFFFSPPL